MTHFKNGREMTLALVLGLASMLANADRFTSIVEEGAGPTTTAGGYLINNKRVAVQKELAQRPPTPDELGVKLPPGSKIQLEETARQIAQYHPAWRIYQYRIKMSRADLIDFFQTQGLSFDQSKNNIRFGNGGGDFIDGLSSDSVQSFRIWRKPE